MNKRVKSLFMAFTIAVSSITLSGMSAGMKSSAMTNDEEETIVYSQEEMYALEQKIKDQNSLLRKGKDKDEFTVVIDAGHGGRDSGAVNKSKDITEKFINLSLANYVRQNLEAKGVNVIMTRTTDVFVPLKNRSAIANAADADLFVSIHNDSGSSTSKGAHVIYSYEDRYGLSKKMANRIVNSIDEKTIQEKRKSNPVWTRTSHGHDYYSVLRHTDMPAVIVEHSYINNNNLRAVGTDKRRREMAKAVADGIYDTMTTDCKGLTRVRGKYVYYNKDKEAVRGCWVKDGKNQKYLRRNGYLAKGWLNIKGNLYYFNKANVMLTGEQRIDGKTYIFDSNGVLIK